MAFLKKFKPSVLLKMLVFSIMIAFFALLLGLFESVGYRINASSVSIDVSDVDVSTGGYDIYIDVTFNPILHPFHWLIGGAQVRGNMSSMMLYSLKSGILWGRTKHAEGLWDETHYSTGGGQYVSPREAVEYSALTLAFVGLIENSIIIASVCLLIEALHQRFLYGILAAGIIGFSSAGLIGMIVGMAAALAFYIIFKTFYHERNPFVKLLDSILDRSDSEIDSPDTLSCLLL